MSDVRKKSAWEDFFAFRTMLSLSLVKIIYAIGLIIITSFGIVIMVAGISDFSGLLGIIAGSGVILFGNLIWRVICEWWVVFFSMHEQVVKIAENTSLSGEYSLNDSLKLDSTDSHTPPSNP